MNDVIDKSIVCSWRYNKSRKLSMTSGGLCLSNAPDGEFTLSHVSLYIQYDFKNMGGFANTTMKSDIVPYVSHWFLSFSFFRFPS